MGSWVIIMLNHQNSLNTLSGIVKLLSLFLLFYGLVIDNIINETLNPLQSWKTSSFCIWYLANIYFLNSNRKIDCKVAEVKDFFIQEASIFSPSIPGSFLRQDRQEEWCKDDDDDATAPPSFSKYWHFLSFKVIQ